MLETFALCRGVPIGKIRSVFGLSRRLGKPATPFAARS